MSKRAEEAALKAYPDYPTMDGGYVTQRKPRKVFIQGYEQAEKETIERAVAWLATKLLREHCLFECEVDDISQEFKKAMEEEQ